MIFVFVVQVYLEVRGRVVRMAARPLLRESLNRLYCNHMVGLDKSMSDALSAVYVRKLLFWLTRLLPIFEVFLNCLLSRRRFKFGLRKLPDNWWDYALLWCLCQPYFMSFYLNNGVLSLIGIVIFIKFVSLLGPLSLRVRILDAPVAAFFFHIFHNFPNVVLILLLDIELGGIVMVDVIPQILWRVFLPIYL